MPKAKTKVKISKDELTIEEGEDTLVGKLIAGTKGDVIFKSPFGRKTIKNVRKASDVPKASEIPPIVSSRRTSKRPSSKKEK